MKRGREKRGRKRERPARKLLCSLFFRPPDERKNPDWSDLMNYLIHPSDWSATCHSKPQRSSHIYIQQGGKSRDRFELILEEALRSLEENGIKFALKAQQRKAIERFYEKQIF